jgi:hypothetical protein
MKRIFYVLGVLLLSCADLRRRPREAGALVLRAGEYCAPHS